MRYAAFRLFGEFIWPPMPDELLKTHPKDSDPAAGVVETHFQEISPGKLAACVRWLPKERLKAGDQFLVSAPFPDGSPENVYDRSPEQLAERRPMRAA